MRKIIKSIVAVTLSLATLGTVAGCGGGNENKVDATGTIVIEPFANSSFGLAWIEKMAENWKAETGSQFKVLVKKNSTLLSGSQLDVIEATNTDIYFGSEAMYNSGFYKGYFEDLSDLLDVKPDGENGKTIREKIPNYDTSWKKLSSIVKYNAPAGVAMEERFNDEYFSYEGCYLLPFSTTFTGILYDHDLFVSQGLMEFAEPTSEVKAALTEQGITYEESDGALIFKSATNRTNFTEGDEILTAGKDGKYGTYDDGQPQTFAELEVLCNKIMAKGRKPFLYSDTEEYATNLFNAYMVQKHGMPLYTALSYFDSQGEAIKMKDGSSKVISWNNGYEVYSVEGIEGAASLIKKYFIDGNSESRYYRTTSTFGDARDEFVTNNANNKMEMIIDGNWFVTGADSILRENRKDPDTIDYRFMLLPEIEGQKGIDGNGKGSVVNAPETGGIAVRKQPANNPEKLEAIKSFLTYMLKNDTLSWVTQSTGCLLNYDYTLTDEQIGAMPQFYQTCYDLFHDTENVFVTKYSVDKLVAPMRYSSNNIYSYSMIPLGSNDSNSIISTMKGGMAASKLADIVAAMYSKADWEQIIDDTIQKLS